MRHRAVLAASALAAGALWWARRRRRVARALARLCAALPKAELHAHLHGSARLATIGELGGAAAARELRAIEAGDERSLAQCFAIFGHIHGAVASAAAVKRVALEVCSTASPRSGMKLRPSLPQVLDDFASENVRYLELRTTPRALADADAEGYVRTVLEAFAEHEAGGGGGEAAARGARPRPRLVPRLLLSADRSAGAAAALATVRLAAALRARDAHGARTYLVGVDFSGNPTKGSFAACAAAFGEARAAGLLVAAHVAEVDDADDTTAVLDFGADRLGHALRLTRAHRAAIRAARTPVEICPTSNCKTLGLGRRVGLRAHPTLRFWLARGHPVSINTDDAGVFATSASRELARVALEAYPLRFLRAEAVVALSAAPLDHAFEPADSAAMRALRAEFAAEGAAALARYHEELRGWW